jgi:FKBP-type peptidyl-prolyl cis-trans isomerase
MAKLFNAPLALLLAGCLALVSGCSYDDQGVNEIKVPTDKGLAVLRYTDLVEGKGETVKKFDVVEVHYTGWTRGGYKFDSSLDRGKPFQTIIGARQVIQGWDEGIPGMKVGGKRKLFIPSELAYGDRGTPDGKIKPGAKLTFEVEVLRILKPGEFDPK